jgi:hypothetical protein
VGRWWDIGVLSRDEGEEKEVDGDGFGLRGAGAVKRSECRMSAMSQALVLGRCCCSTCIDDGGLKEKNNEE